MLRLAVAVAGSFCFLASCAANASISYQPYVVSPHGAWSINPAGCSGFKVREYRTVGHALGSQIALDANGNPWFINNQKQMATFSGGRFHFYQWQAPGSKYEDIVLPAPNGVYSFEDVTYGSAGVNTYTTLEFTDSSGTTTGGPEWMRQFGGSGSTLVAASDPSTGLVWGAVSNHARHARVMAGDMRGFKVHHDLLGSDHRVMSIVVAPTAVYVFDSREYHLSQVLVLSKTGSIVRSITVPNGVAADSMILGPLGYVWFADRRNNAIGSFTPTGRFREYSLEIPYAGVVGLARGPELSLWATTRGDNGLEELAPKGEAYLQWRTKGTPYFMASWRPHPGCASTKVWFTENDGIGVISYS